MKEWKDETNKWIDKTSNNLMIVSVLIATVAFTAGFNVPGSYDDYGLANLRHKRPYYVFLILDTIAMVSSVSATFLLVLTKAVPTRGSWYGFFFTLLLLWTSLLTMEFAFVEAIILVLGRGKSAIKAIVVVVSVNLFLLPMVFILRRTLPANYGTMIKFLSTIKKQSKATPTINSHLLKAAFYIAGIIFSVLSNYIYLLILEVIILIFQLYLYN